MAIVLRKAGVSAPVKITPPPAKPPVEAKSGEFKSPFKESYHVEEKAKDADPPTVTPPPAVSPATKPKAVFKVLGGRPITPRATTVQADADPAVLTKAAGIAPLTPFGVLHPESRAKWPPCAVGTRVVITNSLFPWVKHYKPGDECIVESIPPNLSLAEDPWKYKSHLLRIVSPDTPRKGHTIMLFRWEFEPVPENRNKTREGRVITQS